jgi:hypothetical protein
MKLRGRPLWTFDRMVVGKGTREKPFASSTVRPRATDLLTAGIDISNFLASNDIGATSSRTT